MVGATLGTGCGGVWDSLVVQMITNLPATRETHVWSLGWEDPLEKGMETHSSILTWRIPWTEEADGLQFMGLRIVGHDWATHAGWLTDCWWRMQVYRQIGTSAWFFKRIQWFQFLKHLICFSIWRLFWYLFWSRIFVILYLCLLLTVYCPKYSSNDYLCFLPFSIPYTSSKTLSSINIL